MLNVSQGIRSLTDFKRETPKFLDDELLVLDGDGLVDRPGKPE